MSNLTSKNKSTEILEVYGKEVETGNPVIYAIEPIIVKETGEVSKSFVQLCIIQKLSNVPSRSNSTSKNFAASNMFAADAGIETSSANTVYRNLTMVTKEIATKLEFKPGTILEGYGLEIVDTNTPQYEGHEQYKSDVNKDGSLLVPRTNNGLPIYTNSILKRASEVQHNILKVDALDNKPQAKKATVADLKSEFSNNLF